MPIPPVRLRRKLAEGGVAAGAALASFSPEVMDVAGLAGLDFVRIDHEHAFRRDASTEALVRAGLAAGVAAAIRIDRAELELAPKLLEIGAEAVIVAGIRGANDASDVARATRFPPLGERGYSPNCFSARWGTHDAAEWLAWSNAEPLVGVTIEHPDAVSEVDAIVATPGLDFVQFGWADFSVAIGLPRPDKFHPRVVATRARVFGAARQAGRHVMMGIEAEPQAVADALRLGVRMLEFGRDLAVLLRTWTANAALAQAQLAAHAGDQRR
jgi:4-hydroxy-2-oxoheptanedioate aldolase